MALQLALQKSALEETDTQKVEITARPERLVSKSAELSQVPTKHTELTDKFILVKW